MYRTFLATADILRVQFIFSSSKRKVQSLVSTAWLNEKFVEAKNDNIKLVHAVLKSDDFSSHIPGAACFDVSVCRDTDSPYPNMLPEHKKFEDYVTMSTNVSNDDHVIIYDNNMETPDLLPGARVWCMFKIFGHDKVSLLNGGFFKWMDEGRPISKQLSVSPSKKKPFRADFRSHLVATYEDVLKNIEDNRFQLIDARSTARFEGNGEDPYGKSGHIPKAINVPYANLIDPETKLIKNETVLRALFEAAKVDLHKSTISQCGSGVTACALLFAQHLCGKYDGKLYDGSWAEWINRAEEKHIVRD